MYFTDPSSPTSDIYNIVPVVASVVLVGVFVLAMVVIMLITCIFLWRKCKKSSIEGTDNTINMEVNQNLFIAISCIQWNPT